MVRVQVSEERTIREVLGIVFWWLILAAGFAALAAWLAEEAVAP